MLFNSPSFLFAFLPAVLLGFFALQWTRQQKFQAHFLFAASLAFYGAWSVRFLVLLLASIVANYAFGRLLSARPSRWLLALGIGADLALLGTFKYLNFGIATLDSTFGLDLALTGIILPLGISFYTFTQIAYLVDAYRGRAPDRDFVRYGLFVSFFPHLIAGPILHHEEMTRQFRDFAKRHVNATDIAVGVTLFAIGLFKKMVLADSFAPLANAAFGAAGHGTTPGALAAWSSVLAYALQIYFDFSGYIDMALGLARMLGIAMPQNFNSPYKAASIAQFWQRWNMTLSRFLRDYLYIPLGGNRNGTLRSDLNVLITMLLGGLWHGAAWTFVLWGALHGVFIVAGRVWERFAQRRGIALPHAAGVALTFFAVLLAWVPFRASGFGEALTMYRAMFGNWTTAGAPSAFAFAALAAGLAIVWLAPNLQELLARYRPVLGEAIVPGRLQWRLTGPFAAALAVLILSTVILGRHVSPFLYFQF